MSGEEQDVKSNNIKIAVTAVMSVLLGAAFIMALILFGMRFQTNLDAKAEEKKRSEEIVTINSVDFKTDSFAYKAPSGENEVENYLVNLINKESKDDYVVINSNSMLEDVLNALRGASGDNNISYSVDKDFFNSGSVVLVTHEAAKLSDFRVNTVTRDADYNLQIDAVAKYGDSNLDTIDGRAVFVKISNIQPKDIEVKIEKEE
jgi:hypothetical protein